jgi:murein DD-endopeptidase MepM/ murein hydrolase activator NlpD
MGTCSQKLDCTFARGPFVLLSRSILAGSRLVVAGLLVAAGVSWANSSPPEAPVLPQLPAANEDALGAPLRPTPEQVRHQAPRSFDASLDELVRQGVVSPAERVRLRQGAVATPFDVPAHQQACRSGALSAQECRTGVVLRWRGRFGGGDGLLGGGQQRLGTDGRPLPPLTVPVSALLAGEGGSFRLSDVFAVTPRPAPILGNGNRSLLFPLIGSASTSSAFGMRLHPILGSWLMHAGKDLAAPEGTPVVAALAGRVVSSGLAGGYGLAIEIEHDRPRRRTLYGHLSELYVKTGERVRQGEVIGRVGSTGLSTGPHLHFELRLPGSGGWVAVDPGDLDPGSGARGSDAIALLVGELLRSLERPGPRAG